MYKGGTLAKTYDQYAADTLGADTPLRSIELTTEQTFAGGGSVFRNSTSWRAPTQPLFARAQPAHRLRAYVW